MGTGVTMCMDTKPPNIKTTFTTVFDPSSPWLSEPCLIILRKLVRLSQSCVDQVDAVHQVSFSGWLQQSKTSLYYAPGLRVKRSFRLT